jgi:hypothetical protein
MESESETRRRPKHFLVFPSPPWWVVRDAAERYVADEIGQEGAEPDVRPRRRTDTKSNMTRLEDLQPTAVVRGILTEQIVTVVTVQRFGYKARELTYKGPPSRVQESER